MRRRSIGWCVVLLLCLLASRGWGQGKHSLMREDANVVPALLYGSTKNATTLNTALTAIGTADKTLLLSPGAWVLNAAVTVPRNVTLWVSHGATVDATSFALTVNGPLIPPPISDWYTGTVTLNFPHGEGLHARVVTGCQPTTSASLTLAAFACTAVVRDGLASFPVGQAAASITVANQPVVWLAIHRHRSTAVAGWTRHTDTHYLSQASATPPATPTGAVLFARLTISASAVTAVQDYAPRSAVPPGNGLDLRAYGVVGDDSTDNTAALQAGLNAQGPVPGIRYLPAGIYRIKDIVTIPSGVCLVGAGMGATTIKLDPTPTLSNDEYLLSIVNSTGSCIKYLTVDVNRANVTGVSGISGIAGTNTQYAVIEGVEVKNTIGSTAGGTAIGCGVNCNHNWFINNYIHDVGHPRFNTLIHTNASATLVEGATTIGGYSGLTVDVHAGTFVQITGPGILDALFRVHANTATELQLGGQVWEQASGTYTAKIYTNMDIGDGIFLKGWDNLISGNMFKHIADGCATISGGSVGEAAPRQNIVMGNHCEHSTSNSGYTLGPGGASLFAGNVTKNNGQHGLIIEHFSETDVGYVPPTIIGNHFSAEGWSCILNTYDRITIVGNTCVRTGRHGIQTNARMQHISGNTFVNIGGHAIWLEGDSSPLHTNASASIATGGTVVTGYAGLTVNAYAEMVVVINSEAYVILSNTATQLNILGQWQQTGGTVTANIYRTNRGSTITNNQIENTGFGETPAFPNAYGILLSGAQFDVQIENNHLYHTTDAASATIGINIRDAPALQIGVGASNKCSGAPLRSSCVNYTAAKLAVLQMSGKHPHTLVTHGAAQTIADNTPTLLQFTTELTDDAVAYQGLHSNTSNPERITVDLPGVWRVCVGGISFAVDVDGYRQVAILHNGTTAFASDNKAATPSVSTRFSFCAPDRRVAGGDYFVVQVMHTAGNALDVESGGLYGPWFSVTRVGE